MVSLSAGPGTSPVLSVLAAEESPRGVEFGKASPIGLVFIVLLLIVTLLLIRHMNKQLRKLPSYYDTEGTEINLADHSKEAEARRVAATGRGAKRMSYWEYRMNKAVERSEAETQAQQAIVDSARRRQLGTSAAGAQAHDDSAGDTVRGTDAPPSA